MGTLLGIASLLVAVGTTAMWWRGMQNVSLHRGRTPYFVAWGVAFAFGVAAWFHGPGWLGGVGAVFGLLLGGICLGLAALSAQDARTPAVAVGGPMLAFSAPDDTGEVFDSASLAGKPFLMKFFRGHW